jgi:hypothetical protein
MLRRLSARGLALEPFCVMLEGGDSPAHMRAPGPDYVTGFLTEGELEEIAHLEAVPLAELRDRSAAGHLCFAVRQGPRCVAKMWCDLQQFNYPPFSFPLHANEAYLYAAATDPSERGMGLAPYMRLQCYAALRGLGRTRLYSYTDYFNTPAKRFKKKLKARRLATCLHVGLFDRYERTWTLWDDERASALIGSRDRAHGASAKAQSLAGRASR